MTEILSKKLPSRIMKIIFFKTIATLFMLRMLLGIHSFPIEAISGDNLIGDKIYTLESWSSLKLFMEIMVLGLIIGIISLTTNEKSISKLNHSLILLHIGILSFAFILALFSPFRHLYIIAWQLLASLGWILLQTSRIIPHSKKTSYRLSLVGQIFSGVSPVFLFIFIFYT